MKTYLKRLNWFMFFTMLLLCWVGSLMNKSVIDITSYIILSTGFTIVFAIPFLWIDMKPKEQEIDSKGFITEELLKELGFKLVSFEKSQFGKHYFGKAQDRIELTHISWSTQGHSCTYFGEKLPPNINLLIKKDGGTRTVFNGYVFNVDDFKRVLKMTW